MHVMHVVPAMYDLHELYVDNHQVICAVSTRQHIIDKKDHQQHKKIKIKNSIIKHIIMIMMT